MDTFIDDEKWLEFLCAQLEAKNFPAGTITRLKVIAAVIANQQQTAESLDKDVYRAREELGRMKHGLFIAGRDIEELYARYKIVCKELGGYNPERAAVYLQYKPGLFSAFSSESPVSVDPQPEEMPE